MKAARSKSARGKRVRAKEAGSPPDDRAARYTVVYVHGIGAKPRPSVLKCQWDTALFGCEMGDRTRMAFWVDPERHPDFEDATCGDPDRLDLEAERGATIGVRALEDDENWTRALVSELAPARRQQEVLQRIAARMMQRTSAIDARWPRATGVEARILPAPLLLRKLVARALTRLFLRDVHDFLFDTEKRTRMKDILRSRLVGPGPFVVIGHSQGSMIAYDVLRELDARECRVPLFVTIGSPLGIQEVQDVLKSWGPLAVPACVERWKNFADGIDPVAADPTLADDFRAPSRIEDKRVVNRDAGKNPHSETGYLATTAVRTAVRGEVGPEFGQAVTPFVIARDLVADVENDRESRHPILIELVLEHADAALSDRREAVVRAIEAVVPKRAREEASIDPLRRFVSAELTRHEIEQLAHRVKDLRIERIWRNAEKRALLEISSQRVQAAPAHVTYAATGRDVHWAVLDTGIHSAHPHFSARDSIAAGWNCTSPGPPRRGHAADDHGHGTHVAGIIAGAIDVELSQPDGARPVRISGIAPDAKLHVYKVLDSDGKGRDASIIKALEHVYDANERAGRIAIAGVNLSLGGSFDPRVYGCGHSPLCQELRRLWRQGVLVCLAAGNEGYAVLQSEDGTIESNMDLSIGDPANLDEAIAVGSVHKDQPHIYGVSYFSSRGPTADGRAKPDLVAPGERIRSASYRAPAAVPNAGTAAADYYIEMSGTSMAAPHVSGVLAAFLSVRRELIGFPDRVKRLLLDQCTDLGRDPYIQGRGMPNLMRMLEST